MRRLLVAVVMASCGDNIEPAPRMIGPAPAEVTTGVDSAELAALLVDHWDFAMELDPVTATFLGDRRFDAWLAPASSGDVLAFRERRRALLARAEALGAGLSVRDRITLAVLVERLAADAGLDVCDYERWAAGYTHPVFGLETLGDWHPLDSDDDAASFRARLRAMPVAIAAYGDELAAGADQGLTDSRAAVMRTMQRLDGMASQPAVNSPLVAAARSAGLDAAARTDLVDDVTALVANRLQPAYRDLRATLARDVLPRARAAEGLSGLPGGAACYAAEIRRHTTLVRSAEELHALGQSEVARIEAEMIALGTELWGATSLAQIRAELDSDPALRFASRDAVLASARATIARAREVTAPLFARFPSTDVVVEAYPEGVIAAASYLAPPLDGSMPGRYFLAAAAGAPTWGQEATTYHEAIPGHHLQLGRAIDLTDLPAMRRVFTDTAYVEGWGLYAERLAGEVGLYSSPASRLGALSLEAFRACRLVVDTGVHALRWTRDDAEAFMRAHTIEGPAYIAGEVERYLTRPGQALAYKVGQLDLLRLRDDARAARGEAFALRDFHEAVLGEGSLPLLVLDERIAAWIAGEPAPVHAPGARASRLRAAPRRDQ
jgi:uncharacterized protein (DUF885 family)